MKSCNQNFTSYTEVYSYIKQKITEKFPKVTKIDIGPMNKSDFVLAGIAPSEIYISATPIIHCIIVHAGASSAIHTFDNTLSKKYIDGTVKMFINTLETKYINVMTLR